MSTRTLRRAGLDFGRLQEAVESSSTIVSVENADEHGEVKNGDVFHWRVVANPPASSIYAGATYAILFTLSPDEYPFKPPKVRVLTPIFNPMVSDVGGVCEALLDNAEWKPTVPVVEVVEKVIVSVFVDFKKFDILNDVAAEMMTNKTPAEFKKEVDRVRTTAKS
ncbi:putative ubiquitin-conjugating enzyme [Leptomonas pyrrhocoris]|uniref:Putative ubiquitin-conjugating enzyme n=1 Tax=Leptomonas pyrrhocoris TaxID=157538 RepID=A0A0N0DWV9_LEPPY|nr:putative ubiquitin-conjugating enzyme [Leptomonas pyrrhocoris]KPA82232.1 putative ubiquitin-conjugating enzyme [Leptomonas pyrrhocoris]|eukprot:XP_015660671.1 putative ubiquitin-conjugating enzyme [Leptomonas pyrrhocoris]